MNCDIERENKTYLTALTPLRGIAAIFVVMHHSSLYFGSFIPHSVTYFFENGWVWVDFFFILSGFILTYAYSRYFGNGVTFRAYKKYIVARFARIYPLHFITMLWAFAVVAAIVYMAASIDSVVADLYNIKALFPCLLLIQDLHLYKQSPLNFPAWSLSAEWWMYLVFPFLVPYFTLLTKWKALFTLILIAAAYVTMRYVLGPVSGTPLVNKPTINMVADFGVLRCMAGFCTGMLLHVFYKARLGYAVLKSSIVFILLFALTLYAIHAGIIDIVIVALFPFVLLAAAYNETSIKKILENRILQRLGDWSFSIYMVHGPIILMLLAVSVYKDPNLLSNLASSGGDEDPNSKIGLVYCFVLVTLTLLVSSFTYRFIEIPAGKYLKRALSKKI